MIVTETNVHDALAYLAMDPHPIALARKDVTDTENECKHLAAMFFLEAEGSVAQREAEVECHVLYREAKREETKAIFELERHKARVRAAEMLLEIWRTENANARAAERVR